MIHLKTTTFCLASLLWTTLGSHLHAATKPNIIVIFTDDHGWADLGANEVRSDIRTPHLDLLTKGGLRATSGYVTAPQCVPSRAGLLSGRYQTRFGVDGNGSELKGFDAEKTLADCIAAINRESGENCEISF